MWYNSKPDPIAPTSSLAIANILVAWRVMLFSI